MENEKIIEEKTEVVGPRNFRNNPDVESFYRFIHTNDLRLETKVIIQKIINAIKGKKEKKKIQ